MSHLSKENLIKSIKFIKEGQGVDNLYIGPFKKIKSLIEKFHFNLDEITKNNKDVYNQEILVSIVAKKYNDVV